MIEDEDMDQIDARAAHEAIVNEPTDGDWDPMEDRV